MKNEITFEQIANFLPKSPRSHLHEAFEFRFLFAMDTTPKELLVEANEEMLRVTFPMWESNGRGRIWLLRNCSHKIDSEDIQTFMSIVKNLSDISGLKIDSRGNTTYRIHFF